MGLNVVLCPMAKLPGESSDLRYLLLLMTYGGYTIPVGFVVYLCLIPKCRIGLPQSTHQRSSTTYNSSVYAISDGYT